MKLEAIMGRLFSMIFPQEWPIPSLKNLCLFNYVQVGLVKNAIQFLSLFPRDMASCLLLRTACFSCLLAKTFDTSVDGPAVHKTAERHISARFPQGVTEGSVSAEPRLGVSGSRSQWNLLPVFKSKTQR